MVIFTMQAINVAQYLRAYSASVVNAS